MGVNTFAKFFKYKLKFKIMKKKKIDITFVLDRSGSMLTIQEETIKGFNDFLNSQKNTGGEATITLAQFDDQYEMLYEEVKLKEVKELNSSTYVPRGMTALLDAIGKTIKLTRKRHKLLNKDKQPDKVLFVIITDGFENSSIVYTREKIFKKIRKMEDKHQWEFVFLAANQDAIAEAHHYGIKANKAMTFAADKPGTEGVFLSLHENIDDMYLMDKDFEFTDEQREKQKRPNNK
jgi:uncharacterized protein YegL